MDQIFYQDELVVESMDGCLFYCEQVVHGVSMVAHIFPVLLRCRRIRDFGLINQVSFMMILNGQPH